MFAFKKFPYEKKNIGKYWIQYFFFIRVICILTASCGQQLTTLLSAVFATSVPEKNKIVVPDFSTPYLNNPLHNNFFLTRFFWTETPKIFTMFSIVITLLKRTDRNTIETDRKSIGIYRFVTGLSG